jgi:hypothetical protein
MPTNLNVHNVCFNNMINIIISFCLWMTKLYISIQLFLCLFIEHSLSELVFSLSVRHNDVVKLFTTPIETNSYWYITNRIYLWNGSYESSLAWPDNGSNHPIKSDTQFGLFQYRQCSSLLNLSCNIFNFVVLSVLWGFFSLYFDVLVVEGYSIVESFYINSSHI